MFNFFSYLKMVYQLMGTPQLVLDKLAALDAAKDADNQAVTDNTNALTTLKQASEAQAATQTTLATTDQALAKAKDEAIQAINSSY